MLAELVTAAGNALVTAAVTDGWEGMRARVARLFGRGEPDPAVERRLDATQAALAAVPPGELDNVRARLEGQWETRFADLLAEYPDAEGELAALLREFEAAGPVVASGGSLAAGRDVRVAAEGGSLAAGVIHGSVTVPGARVPEGGPPDPTLPGLAGG